MYKYYSEPREKYHDRIMELYFKEGVSVTALTEKFPVSNRTISRWIRIFANENNLGLHRMVRKIKAVQNLQINKKDIKQPEKSEKQGIPELMYEKDVLGYVDSLCVSKKYQLKQNV